MQPQPAESGAAAGQLLASAQLEGRLAQAVVAGTLQGPSPDSAAHRHPPACLWGQLLPHFFFSDCIHPKGVLCSEVSKILEEGKIGQHNGEKLCESRARGALCIRQHPSHRCYRASLPPTFSLYLHRTSVLSLESQLDDFCGLRSVTDVC